MASTKKSATFYLEGLAWVGLCAMLCGFPCRAAQAPTGQTAKGVLPDSASTEVSTPGQQTDQQPSGSITGKVVDQSGATVSGVLVKLKREGQTSDTETFSDDEGQFYFSNVAPGSFQLTITSEGLASRDFSGTLNPGEAYHTPLIMLTIATQVTEVHVGLTADELADVQIQEQVHQRVLGFIPNFYVSYVPNAAPLAPKHKFELAWKSATDPITLVGVGVLAGVEQATDRWGAYGQGAQGYGKRYGATYVNIFSGTLIGGAVLPSLLKQDPRYFYKGRGSKVSRLFYAMGNSVFCKGDNGKWQPNYSNVLGSFAAAGLANLYYPANDRRGSSFIVSTAVIRLGETSLASVLEEFVLPKLSRKGSTRAQAQP
ncbi:MAG: carboxypeptidase-like regulatory domain-containing protein [Candidatus Acidiferrum sp.]